MIWFKNIEKSNSELIYGSSLSNGHSWGGQGFWLGFVQSLTALWEISAVAPE